METLMYVAGEGGIVVVRVAGRWDVLEKGNKLGVRREVIT